MKHITLVTGNQNKLKEFQDILSIEALNHADIDLTEVQDINVENVARHKAHEAYKILKKPVMVEDTAFILDEFKTLPGPFIKFFENEFPKTAMIKMLGSSTNRAARSITVIAYYDGTREIIAKGELHGTVSHEPRGESGFGFDHYFIPNGQNKTFAELTPEEKNEKSQRKLAIEEFKQQYGQVL